MTPTEYSAFLLAWDEVHELHVDLHYPARTSKNNYNEITKLNNYNKKSLVSFTFICPGVGAGTCVVALRDRTFVPSHVAV